MGQLRVDNYLIDAPIKDILERAKIESPSGKLRTIDARSGHDNIVVTCPFHSGGHESKAACNVYVGDDSKANYGFFRCFVCGEQGPLEKLIASVLNTSVENAKLWLIKNFNGVELSGIKFGSAITVGKKRKKVVKTLPLTVLDEYQSWHPYLAKRNLTRSTCEQFNLRYDSKNRQIIFPYFNEEGKLVTLLKRAIDSKLFYIEEGIDKPVYGVDNLVKSGSKRCIITEGLFDCLLANQYGFPTIATLGNPGPTQFELINKLGLSVVYLMFDNDTWGRKFTEMMHKHLAKNIMIVDVNIEDPYKDIGDLDRETFWKFINNANNNQTKNCII